MRVWVCLYAVRCARLITFPDIRLNKINWVQSVDDEAVVHVARSHMVNVRQEFSFEFSQCKDTRVKPQKSFRFAGHDVYCVL